MLLPLLKLGPQRNKQMFSIFNLWVLRLTWSKWVGNPDFFGPKMSKIWNRKDMCPLFVVPSVICNDLQPQIKTISQIIPFQPPSLQNRCAEEEFVSESRLWSSGQVLETMLLRNQKGATGSVNGHFLGWGPMTWKHLYAGSPQFRRKEYLSQVKETRRQVRGCLRWTYWGKDFSCTEWQLLFVNR